MSPSQAVDDLIKKCENCIVSLGAYPNGGSGPTRTLYTSVLLGNFDVGSSNLKPEHLDYLRSIQPRLKAEEMSVISIVGRTSQTGEPGNNERLRIERATAVRDCLQAGLPPGSPRLPATPAAPGDVLVNAPGREAERNRSVELQLYWEWVEPVKPEYVPGPTKSRYWQLDLMQTTGAGLIIGGQQQLGTLTMLTEQGLRIGPSQAIAAFMLGIDFGKSILFQFSLDIPLPGAKDGKFTLDEAVGFDWFEDRAFDFASVGGAAVIGGVSYSWMWIRSAGFWSMPAAFTTFNASPTGLIAGVGVELMVGVLNFRWPRRDTVPLP